MKNNKKQAIILLSGGLDCTVALSLLKDKYDTEALIFNYGQKAFKSELKAAKKISQYYKIHLEIIKLDWLKEITNASTIQDKDEIEAVDIDNKKEAEQSAKHAWIPNRNSIFINIAASYLDAKQGGIVIIGANKEEAQTFPDNSLNFINSINKTLKYSCQNEIEVLAPLIDKNKSEIVDLAINNKTPLNLVYSCWQNSSKHCGKCESCQRLKRALKNNNCDNLIKELFL